MSISTKNEFNWYLSITIPLGRIRSGRSPLAGRDTIITDLLRNPTTAYRTNYPQKMTFNLTYFVGSPSGGGRWSRLQSTQPVNRFAKTEPSTFSKVIGVRRTRWRSRPLSQPPAIRCCAAVPTNITDEGVAVLRFDTSPIEGQTTGTSGLRKKTVVLVSQPNFLPNWIQSLFNALGGESFLSGKTLILGGDGRFYNKAGAQTIIRMAAANGVQRVIVGRDGILTTPAVSAMIPRRCAVGGVVLTASHNPAGPHGDWGVKYNTERGAPALEGLTSKIYDETTRISEYFMADLGADVNLKVEGETSYGSGQFVVEVVNPVTEYLALQKTLFDFEHIRQLVARPDFSLVFDAMHASTGEYAHALFCDELGCPSNSVINGTPLDDFGGGHPDPNLTYAAELVALLNPKENPAAPHFGAASDGDGDRNMILGQGVFVSPGDSVAIIADYAERAIPSFKDRGLTGVARSMPTSSALDRVANAHGIPVFETPTGWKYFTNLMDAGRISICGEESFGTGSDHIREKDGLWAVLSWLSILAYENHDTPVGKLVTVEDILIQHWRKYGRTYNMRYDYESVSSEAGDSVMSHLRSMIDGDTPLPPEIATIEEFRYVDPVDGSVTSKQGVRLTTPNGSRVVFRLSGTGSSGATIRIYFEKYEASTPSFTVNDPKVVFEELVRTTLKVAKIQEATGRDAPTVIT